MNVQATLMIFEYSLVMITSGMPLDQLLRWGRFIRMNSFVKALYSGKIWLVSNKNSNRILSKLGFQLRLSFQDSDWVKGWILGCSSTDALNMPLRILCKFKGYILGTADVARHGKSTCGKTWRKGSRPRKPNSLESNRRLPAPALVVSHV